MHGRNARMSAHIHTNTYMYLQDIPEVEVLSMKNSLSNFESKFFLEMSSHQ